MNGFHVISVPIVQCKPTAFAVTNSHIHNIPTIHHTSHPTIAPPTEPDRPAQPEAKAYGINAYQFNTIPLKSHYNQPPVCSCQLWSATAYRSRPPPPPVSSTTDEHCSESIDLATFMCDFSCIPFRGEAVPLENGVSTDTCQNGECNSEASTKKENGVTENGEAKRSEKMENLVQTLYQRKAQILQQLTKEQEALVELNAMEASVTGSWPTINATEQWLNEVLGLNSMVSLKRKPLGVPNFIASRFKRPASRRSKSAHERIVQNSCENSPRSMVRSTVQRSCVQSTPIESKQPISRTDTTAPRRLLRWWRQHKPSYGIDETRRQSVNGTADTTEPKIDLQRCRGSSMPPCEQRTSGSTEDPVATRRPVLVRMRHSHCSAESTVLDPVARSSGFVIAPSDVQNSIASSKQHHQQATRRLHLTNGNFHPVINYRLTPDRSSSSSSSVLTPSDMMFAMISDPNALVPPGTVMSHTATTAAASIQPSFVRPLRSNGLEEKFKRIDLIGQGNRDSRISSCQPMNSCYLSTRQSFSHHANGPSRIIKSGNGVIVKAYQPRTQPVYESPLATGLNHSSSSYQFDCVPVRVPNRHHTAIDRCGRLEEKQHKSAQLCRTTKQCQLMCKCAPHASPPPQHHHKDRYSCEPELGDRVSNQTPLTVQSNGGYSNGRSEMPQEWVRVRSAGVRPSTDSRGYKVHRSVRYPSEHPSSPSDISPVPEVRLIRHPRRIEQSFVDQDRCQNRLSPSIANSVFRCTANLNTRKS